jgi:hypothetical protein
MLHDKLREYFKATGVMNGVMDVVEMLNAHILDHAASIGDAEEIKKLNEKYMSLVRGRIDELETSMIDIYADYYTEEDIDALLAFYNTPVAKKTKNISPDLSRRCMKASQDFNDELLKQMSTLVQA